MNKKIFSLLIVLTVLFSVGMVSASENVSDITANEENTVIDDTCVTSEVLESQYSDSIYLENSSESVSTYIITNKSFNKYFTNGELNENVTAGSILDFQGTFTGLNYTVNITKPVSIISSTGDALFNQIGKTASAGGCFHISTGGSGTNVTGLNFINSAFYVTNASNVIIDNINMMANMSGIGQSTGFMCVRGASTYVTIKNSYFENRGTGSSIVVVAYSDYCVVDNNEIVINGSSGNALYVTTFVTPYWDHDPIGINLTNNYIHGKSSGFCIALITAAHDILIENNTIDYNGASGISPQTFWTPKSDATFTYINNKVTGGSAFTTPINSYVADNIAEGTMTVGSNSIAINNDIKGLTLSQANVTASNNMIGEAGVTLNVNAKNTTLTNNIISATVNVKSSGNTIKNNIIDSEDEYAVNLGTSVDNEVSYNNISAAILTGDEAVSANENNSVHDNGNITNIVTKDNFFYFFDSEGNYKGLNFTELIFKGEFNELVNVITIDVPLSIVGMDATLKNIALNLINDSISITNFTMNLDKAPDATNGSVILIDGDDISIDGFIVNYTLNESTDGYIIYANDIDGLNVINGNFKFVGATDGTAINNAVHISESSNVNLNNNNFDISIPASYVSWKEVPAGSGIWVKFPVSEGLVFDEIAGLTVSENNVTVKYSEIVGDYDTIYTIDIKDSEDVLLSDNIITATGHSYIYGLYIESENGIIDNNQFNICADEYYANAIELEATTNTTLSNNIINVESVNVSYPIFSGMNGGELEVDYIANTINSTADIVYGMQLSGSFESVIGNNITVNGNKTTALAIKSKESYISGNNINALGTDEAPSKTTDAFEAMTAGIHLYNAKSHVENNIINSNSKGILADYGIVYVENNEIKVNDNGGNNSYGIIISSADEVSVALNNITYVGNTDGSKINNAILLSSCDSVNLYSNNINITIPSCYVSWQEIPAGSGNWVSSPVSQGVVIKSDNANVENNNITVLYNNAIGSYDTIYAVTISSDNATIESNSITASGHSYIYALQASGDGLSIKNNIIASVSDENYANGINLEGPATGDVENNNISIYSPIVAYGIYTAMSNGDVSINYKNNTIDSISITSYGFSLGGSLENLSDNTISLSGDSTIGIESKAGQLIAENNTIISNGTNPEKTLGIKASKGNASITDNNMNVTGEYTVDVVGANALVKDNYLTANDLTGDASVNYDADTSSVYNNTPKMDKIFLNAEDLVKYYGGNESFLIELTDGAGKGISGENITITINGRNYTRITNESGVAKIAINLPVGEYMLTVSYSSEFTNLSCDASVGVLTTINGADIVKIFKNATQYYANFTDSEGNPLANGTAVTFNINGVFYERKVNENGTARLNINLDQGTYIITATNPENGEMASNTITVLPKITENSDLVKYYRNDSQYVVRIIGDDGNPVGANETVTFNINGVMYERKTNESGHAKLNINLQPGDYIITAMYSGCNVANNITVKPVLNATDISMTYKDGTQFKASLVDGQGNPLAGTNVTFNINGVFYDRTTDSAGIAKLNINLMAGEYIITSMYNDSAISNKITISS